MMRNMRKAALSALAAFGAVAVVGCSPKTPSSAMSDGGLNTGGSQQAAMVNQGRFPSPMYSQEQQPSYALTGQDQTNWVPPDRTVNAGNARVMVP